MESSTSVRRGPKYAALCHHAQVDLYGRSLLLRTLLQVLIGAYLLLVLVRPSKQLEGPPPLHQTPEGHSMSLFAPFPPALLTFHFWAAVLLVGACLLQKHVAMALWDKWQPKRATQYLATRYTDAELRLLHRVLGYLTLLFIVLMAVGGFMLQSRSIFRRIEMVMVVFVSPYVVFVVGMLITVANKMWLAHVVLGDAIFKWSCLAVPLTRVLTAFLQSPPDCIRDVTWTFVNLFESNTTTFTEESNGAVVGISLDTAYYVAIGAISIFVGIWQFIEILGLIAITAANKTQQC